MELFNKYNALATAELGKGSAVWQQAVEDAKNLAAAWEAANQAQKAYEAAQEAYNAKADAAKGSYAGGGVVNYTGTARVHGSQNKPELFLNNAQATNLWNWIDKMAGNPFGAFGMSPVAAALLKDEETPIEDNRVIYENCTFEVTSNANSIDALLKDVQRQSPLKKF